MWMAILEKAWSKVKGSYTNSEGGWMTEGIRALTGTPVEHFTDLGSHDVDMYDVLQAGYEAKFIIGAISTGNSDSTTNACGIPQGHAYSLV